MMYFPSTKNRSTRIRRSLTIGAVLWFYLSLLASAEVWKVASGTVRSLTSSNDDDFAANCLSTLGVERVDECLLAADTQKRLVVYLNDTKAFQSGSQIGCSDEGSSGDGSGSSSGPGSRSGSGPESLSGSGSGDAASARKMRFSLPENVFNARAVYSGLGVFIGPLATPSAACLKSHFAVAMESFKFLDLDDRQSATEACAVTPLHSEYLHISQRDFAEKSWTFGVTRGLIPGAWTANSGGHFPGNGSAGDLPGSLRHVWAQSGMERVTGRPPPGLNLPGDNFPNTNYFVLQFPLDVFAGVREYNDTAALALEPTHPKCTLQFLTDTVTGLPLLRVQIQGHSPFAGWRDVV